MARVVGVNDGVGKASDVVLFVLGTRRLGCIVGTAEALWSPSELAQLGVVLRSRVDSDHLGRGWGDMVHGLEPLWVESG